MKKDVFISYSRKDAAIVDLIEQELLRNNVSCFVDRSHIDLGKDFAEIIAEAIYDCSIILFVWSENSNQSDNTANEIALAVEFEKTIVSFKIGSFRPSPKLAYRLVRFNRIDAATLNEERIRELGAKIGKMLNKEKRQTKFLQNNDIEGWLETNQPDRREEDSRFEIQYKAGKEALMNFELETAFDSLTAPALNNYKDARFLISQITNYRTRIWKIADVDFDSIKKEADNGNSFAQYMLSSFYDKKKNNTSQALKYAQLSADQNDSYGIFQLALCYCYGTGVERNIPLYLGLLNKAVASDNPVAIIHLAKENIYGWDIKRNVSKGLKMLQKAIDMEIPQAFSIMADLHLDGTSLKVDEVEAEKLYHKAISLGFFENYEHLGRMCMYEPVTFKTKTQGTEKGIEYYLQGIEFGETNCMSALASCYYFGNVIECDFRNAMKWYRKAAENGDPHAYFMVGYMYYYGEGVESNNRTAWEWFEQGAKMTSADCYYMMGVMCMEGNGIDRSEHESIRYLEESAFYRGGSGGVSALKLYDIFRTNKLEKYDLLNSEAKNYTWVDQDDGKALEYLKISAEIGNQEALFKYGVFMTDPDLPFSDEFQGRKYLEESLSKGYYLAALRLCYIYLNGIGVSKDLSKAKHYGELAIENETGVVGYYVYGKLLKEYAENIFLNEIDDIEDEDDDNKEALSTARDTIEEARKYLKKACDEAYEVAYQKYYETLMTIYINGLRFSNESLNDCESLIKELIEYLRKTIEVRKYDGCQPLLDMGVCYEMGIGVEKNLNDAIEWYKKAYQLNDKYAPFNIAQIYYENKHKSFDNLKKAIYWYEKAVENGNSNAEESLIRSKKELQDLTLHS